MRALQQRMAAIFNKIAYAGLAIAAVGGIAKTALYNGVLHH